MVVDDDPDILFGFKGILESRGHTVDTAETGGRALEKFAGDNYDVAVVDIRLPDMTGTQVLQRMGGHGRGTKKVIVTGYPSLENAIDSIKQGVDAYLLKPVEPKEFLRIIEDKLSEKRDDDAIIENAVQERYRDLRVKLGLSAREGESRKRRVASDHK